MAMALADAAASRPLRFLVVGAANTVFGYGCFAVLHLLAGERLGTFATLLLAYAVSLPVAFLAHKHLVFRNGGHWRVQAARFALANGTIFAANLALVPATVALTQWPALPVQAVFVALSTLASYLAHSRFSFAR
jgi:putative flippase GtrA